MPNAVTLFNAKRIGLVTIIGAYALLWMFVITWWLDVIPSSKIKMRVPIESNLLIKTSSSEAEFEHFARGGEFKRFDGVVSTTLHGTWQCFRGSLQDNIAHDEVRLLERWTTNVPAVLWSVALGEGYAGPAVYSGRVYVLDYDEKLRADSLRCFSLDDGKEIWRRWYRVRISKNHGYSRTVPAVSERYVVTIGPKCHVMCVDADTGDFKWGLDLVKQYGTQIPLWYTGQCPLIDNNTVVIAPCGKDVLMMGVDCETGKVLWQTPNTDKWQMSHSSIMIMRFAGRKMYVYCAIGGMIGVSAEESDCGTVLWKTTLWKPTIVAPSPVIFDDGRIFVTAGYGAGGMMLKLHEKSEKFTVESLFTTDKSVFACEQHTPILYNGYLYTVLPNDAGENKKQLVCMSPEGRIMWKSGKSNRFGLGPFLIADEKIFVLEDSGILTVAKATPSGYIQLGSMTVLNGKEAWAPMAMVNGRLILRDNTHMICLDMR